MDLWIRSQDKTRLIKAEHLMVGGTYKTEIKVECDVFSISLGEYKTKERALEVLDEIQKYLINNTFAKKMNGLGETLDLIPNSIFVYEMPKE